MTNQITVALIDDIKEMVFDLVNSYAKRLPGLRYADLRVEVGEGQGAAAENGHEKFASRDYGLSFGARVLAGGRVAASGYFGQMLGSADRNDLHRMLRDGLRHAYRRARASAAAKETAQGRFPLLGGSLWNTELAPVPVRQDTIPAQFTIDPRSVSLEDVAAAARDASRAAAGKDGRVVFNMATALTSLARQLFVSSEGAIIDQSFALTEGFVYVVAQGDTGAQEIYDTIGHQRGWEVIAEGSQEEFIQQPSLLDFAQALADDASELCQAPPLPAIQGEAVVVTDPHYNALLVHEVLGHPTELDRALKMETSYAGRSWLLRNLLETQVGKQVASPLLSAFSDPSMPGYGHYRYDDEGTPAQRVVHIDRGIFRGFMNSRQTAALLGVPPNGSYKATDASLVPLIRMSNTCFSAGERHPNNIIAEVDQGYYLAGHRIPSIAESRENFRISARKVYEIRNGQLGQLYCNGGIMADTRDFFMKIDAVGNDFRLFPIPNCGKGQPMQVKRLGNGSPTLRSRAFLTGA